MAGNQCESCEILAAQLAASHERAGVLEKELLSITAQLKEATKLIELQKADIGRYKTLYEKVQPNTPERVPLNQLQLAFARVLASMSDVDATKKLAESAKDDASSVSSTPDEAKPKKKNRDPHGRRGLDIESLPVERIVIDPDDVVASGGDGFELVDEEVSDRLAYQRGGFRRLIISRRIWARTSASALAAVVPSREYSDQEIDTPPSKMLVAPLPRACGRDSWRTRARSRSTSSRSTTTAFRSIGKNESADATDLRFLDRRNVDGSPRRTRSFFESSRR